MEPDKAIAAIEARFEAMGTQDLYEFLGVAPDAPVAEIKKAYRLLTREFHLDKFRSMELGDAETKLNKIFARINEANTTLTNPAKRAEYDEKLAGGGETDDVVTAEQMEDIFAGEEAFRRGRTMLERGEVKGALAKFALAARVNPDDPDTRAYYAYSQFLNASVDDDGKRGPEAKKAQEVLAALVEEEKERVVPLFCYARVLSLQGDTAKALGFFKKVIERDRKHAQAQREIRLISSRKEKKSDGGLLAKLRGLFSKG